MGRDLYDASPEARRVFELCDRLRPGTSEQCFTGREEELGSTSNTQPCLYAVEAAMAAVLQKRGVRPDAVAGFSLGEVAAAACAGVFDMERGFRLVCERGRLMGEDAARTDASMAAVLKLPAETVAELCSRFHGIWPVNFNCPGQVSVSGLSELMPAFFEAVRAAGGRAVPLRVRGGFHSPLMERASEEFGRILAAEPLRPPKIPLYSDLTGEPYAGEPADLMSRQIRSPVLWEELAGNMVRDGIGIFVEIGPGRTLTNIMKRIDPRVAALTFREFTEAGHA